MEPTERERKIEEIRNSPEVKRLHRQQQELLKEIMSEIGRITDDFLEKSLNLVFPGFVADAIKRYSLDPRIPKIVESLMQATLFSVEKTEGVDRNSQVRTVYVGKERLTIGRLEILFDGGRLMFKTQLNEDLVAQPGRPLLDAYNRDVHLCLWHLCNVNGLGSKARRLYILLYDREPEATAEAIDFTSKPVPTLEDSASGVEQRDPTDRG